MSCFVMSDEYPEISKAFDSLVSEIIPSDKILQFHTPEQRHIDMQLLRINDSIFLLQECISLRKKLENKGYNIILCENNVSKNYPQCVEIC